MDISILCEEDANAIFERIESEMNINIPSAILVPIRQKRIISIEANDTYEVDVRFITRENVFDPITIKPIDIENPNLIYHNGLKGVERPSAEEWIVCKKIFHRLAKDMPETLIYNFVGHIPGKKQYVFGNYLITPTGYNNIINGLLKENFEITSASAEFFLDKYLPCFRNQTEGLIVLLSLLLSTNLSCMAKISNERPSFVIAIISPTGGYKTSTAQASLNPYSDTSFSVSSFEDTSASIIAALKEVRDMISIVDDYYTNTDKKITAKLEKVIRLNGDKSSIRKKMCGSKILSESSDTISVITGEQIPKVRISSIPRMLIIDFQSAVNLNALTVLQNSQPEFRGALIKFIQYTLSDEHYSEKLIKKFSAYRDEMTQNERPKWHGRYSSMCCWLLSMYDIFCDFCKTENVSCDGIKDFPQNIRQYIKAQSKHYLENDVIYIFFKAIRELSAQGTIHTISESQVGNDTPKSDLIYNENYIWIESTVVYDKVLRWCQNESIVFNSTRMDLYKRLAGDGLLILQKKKLTGEYRKGKFRQSTVCLAQNNIRRYFLDEREDI